MQARRVVGADGREADIVADPVREVGAEPVLFRHRTGSRIHSDCSDGGADRGQCGCARFVDRRIHRSLSHVWFPQAVGPRDIGPIAVDVGVAMDQDQIAVLQGTVRGSRAAVAGLVIELSEPG